MKIVEGLNQLGPIWHEWRRNGVTSTDIAAIMGKSPYKNAQKVFEEKIGLASPVYENEHMKRGKSYESDAQEWLSKQLRISTFLQPCAENPEHPFMRSSLDYYDPDSGLIAEIKVPARATYIALSKKSAWEEYCQRYYYQVQWHMAVAKKHKCWFVVYSPEEQDAMIRQIPRDENLILEMMKKAQEFWSDLQEGKAPAGDYVIIDDPVASFACDSYKDLLEQKRSIEAQLKQLKDVILSYGNDSNFIIHGLKCIKTQGRSSYAFTQMEDDGIDLNKYKKVGNEFYTIKVSK